MTQQQSVLSRYDAAWRQPHVVIIGAGPVGQRMASELRSKDVLVSLFGEEQWQPYDRVQLSSYLAGEVQETEFSANSAADTGLDLYLGTRIREIDRERKLVIDEQGEVCLYSTLVLATGSRPFIPPVPGVVLKGVFTFRNLDDAAHLKARTVRSRHTVVIGGGLLGLETARALSRFNTQVTIIEQSCRIMFHQMDDDCAAVLQKHVNGMGIDVITGTRVEQIYGDLHVAGIRLSNGRAIACDTVVIAAGIAPNIDLASACGLNTGRGVLVNDSMQTSDPEIYAVGECAEHRQRVYGLVAPGFEQASVAAHVICSDPAEYTGSLTATRLKVVDLPVMSIGEVETEWVRRELAWRNRRTGDIRKLFLAGNRLDAAMAIGEWEEFSRIQESVRTRRRLRPWHVISFLLTGTVWSSQDAGNVADWPAAATVCNCKGVTRGELTTAVDGGCGSVGELAGCTGASSVCGSCKPLLVQLLGAASLEPVLAAGWLAAAALPVMLAAIAWYLPVSLPYADTVQQAFAPDLLWREGLYKQISGYTLLALSVLLSVLALRKRLPRLAWGSFEGWRLVHVLTGALAVVFLAAHTGFRMGDNINFYLLFVFAGLVVAGAAAGVTIGLQHVLPLALARRVRAFSLWAHVLLLWPLPALLGFHVLKTYWY